VRFTGQSSHLSPLSSPLRYLAPAQLSNIRRRLLLVILAEYAHDGGACPDGQVGCALSFEVPVSFIRLCAAWNRFMATVR